MPSDTERRARRLNGEASDPSLLDHPDGPFPNDKATHMEMLTRAQIDDRSYDDSPSREARANAAGSTSEGDVRVEHTNFTLYAGIAIRLGVIGSFWLRSSGGLQKVISAAFVDTDDMPSLSKNALPAAVKASVATALVPAGPQGSGGGGSDNCGGDRTPVGRGMESKYLWQDRRVDLGNTKRCQYGSENQIVFRARVEADKPISGQPQGAIYRREQNEEGASVHEERVPTANQDVYKLSEDTR